jgi:thiamine-phosphate pyrophosphorylase
VTVLQGLATRLQLARLAYVTSTRGGGLAWERRCRELFGAGVDIILIQEPGLAAADLALAVAAAQRAGFGRSRILGLSWPTLPPIDADLLHLATRDRVLVPPERFALVGRPAETVPEVAEQATDPDVDFFTVGPVQATGEADPTRGLGLIRAAARLAPAADLDKPPWFATGGIAADNLDAVLQAGARRLIVRRAIDDAPDPAAAARTLADRLRQTWLADPELTAYARAVRQADREGA